MGVFLDVREVAAGCNKRKVLHGASVRMLKPGTVTGLFGPNAVGKSTPTTALAGIRKPMSGGIVLVRDSGRVVDSELHDVVGYVPQDLLASAPLTAFESVLVSRRRAGHLHVHGLEVEYTAAALRRVGVEHLAGRFVGELSGGQCQLVAVVQMFVRDPEVTLLDKPTSALDLCHQAEPLQLARTEVTSRSSLTLVAVHDPNLTARYCDELVMLHGGHVVAQGSPANIPAPDLLTRIYRIRARMLDDEGVPMVCPIEEGQVSEAVQLDP